MNAPLFAEEDRLELIDRVLADLGAIQRRNRHESLTEDDFHEMMARSRARMLRLRELQLGQPAPIENAEQAVATAERLASLFPGFNGQLQRLAEMGRLCRASDLLDRLPAPPPELTVIDGGRA